MQLPIDQVFGRKPERLAIKRHRGMHGLTVACTHRERHKGPVAVVLELPGGAARAVRDMPLLTEFPLIEAAAHSADCAYPPLQWQPRAVKIAVLRSIAAAVWVKARTFPAWKQFGSQ